MNTYCSKKFHELLAEKWIRSGSDIGQNGRWEMALTKSYGRVDDAFKDKTLAPYSVGSTFGCSSVSLPDNCCQLW